MSLRLLPLPLAFCLSTSPARELPQPPPVPPGAMVIHGGGPVSDGALNAFAKRAGGREAGEGKIAILSTEAPVKTREAWRGRGFVNALALQISKADKVDRAPMLEAIEAAEAVWVDAGAAAHLEGGPLAEAIAELFARGGTVATTGDPIGLLPHSVIGTRYDDETRAEKLHARVEASPGRLGIGLAKSTSLLVDGRSLQVAGSGSVNFLLNASKGRPASRVELDDGKRADYLALTRAAAARAAKPFPPEKPATPELPAGTLVLIGGGSTPRSALDAFIEAAGGDEARIIVINTALGNPPPKTAGELRMFTRAGVEDVRLLHADDREQADSDKFVAQIDRATGLWFSGGRQWRLVDRYAGTASEAAILRLLHERGGVVGGSSAGATICGDYLVRGHPLGNRVMMAEGYERGLALLPGTAVDQHFRQRNRAPDLFAVKRQFPQLLPMGIDETTAALIRGSTLEVLGRGAITLLDRPLPKGQSPKADEHFTLLQKGGRYDLKQRKVLHDPAKSAADEDQP